MSLTTKTFKNKSKDYKKIERYLSVNETIERRMRTLRGICEKQKPKDSNYNERGKANIMRRRYFK
jgi:hypothetical protein